MRRIGALVLLPAAVGLIGAWIALRAFPTHTTQLGPMTVDVSAELGRGLTTVALPPLGEIRFDTHDSPLALRASVADLDVDEISAALRDKSTREIASEIERDATRAMRPIALRVLSVATLGALITGFVAFRTRWRRVVLAAGTALLLVGTSQAIAWSTFRRDAFAEPRFEGTLALAPELLGPAAELTERIDAFRENVHRIVRGAVRAYTALEPQGIGGRGEVRVLHLSDVHLNTLGLDFAVQLARGFDVDLVVDTGDLTSYGTSLEEAIVKQLPRFGRPYVFVRGNHDPPEVGERIESLERGRTLENETTSVLGLDIYGAPHPVYTEDARSAVDASDIAVGARAASARLRSALERLDEPPDVLAVHDDRMAEEVAGLVPLVLSGHFHAPRATWRDGTLFLRAGSTGGAGVNMFRTATAVPLSATVLYFGVEGEDGKSLVAYDLVRQTLPTGRLTIDRHMVDEDESTTATRSPTPGSRRR